MAVCKGNEANLSIHTWIGGKKDDQEGVCWDVDGGDFVSYFRPDDWRPYRTLMISCSSSRQTTARVRLEILGAGQAILGSLVFALDWVGENDMQLWLDNFEPLAEDRDRWKHVTGLRFSCEKAGLWQSNLRINRVCLTAEAPTWVVNESDTLIDISWHTHFARGLEWKMVPELSNIAAESFIRISPQPMSVINREEYSRPIPGDSANVSISAWLQFGFPQRDKPGAIVLERAFNLDVSDQSEILAMMVWDRDTLLTVTALVDGGKEIHLIDQSSPPADEWLTIGASLQGAKRLEAVRMTLQEKPDRTLDHRNIMLSHFWILLRHPTHLDTYPEKEVQVRLVREWTAKPAAVKRVKKTVRQIPFTEPVESTTPIGDPLVNGLPFGFFVRRQDLPALRQNVHSESVKKVFEAIRREADLAVDTDLVDRNTYGTPYGGGVGLPKGVRGAGMRLFAPQAAITHLVTGEAKYAVAARRWILRSALSDDWRGDHGGCVDRPQIGEILPYWSSFTGWYPKGFGGYMDHPFWTADCALGIVVAYDMLYHCFSPAERSLVEESFIRNGFYILADKLRQSRSYYVSMNQGVLFALPLLMMTAFMKDKDPVFAGLFTWTLDFLREFGSRPWNEEGVLGEGPGYGVGTLNEYVEALLPMSACMQKDVREIVPPAFIATMEYIQHIRSTWEVSQSITGSEGSEPAESFTNPDPHFIGFSDGSEYNWLLPELVAFFANILGDRVAQYFWEERFAHEDHVGLSLLFYCGNKTMAQPPALPPAKVYHDQPMAFFRTGWQYGDTLVSLINLRQVTGHGHSDRGSFILEYNREQLMLDPGMISYSDPSSSLYHQTFCHNTLTFSQKSQILSTQVYDTGFLDFLTTSGDDCPGLRGGIDWVIADAGAVYPQAKQFHRHLIFLRPDICILYDQVEAKQPELMELNFTCLGKLDSQPCEDGSALFSSTTRINRVLLHTQATAPLTSQTSQWGTHWEAVPAYRLIRSTGRAELKCQFLTVLAPYALAEEAPTITPLALPGWLGVEVQHGRRVDSVYFRQNGNDQPVNALKTDARGLVLRMEDEKVIGASMWEGSYLLVDGKPLVLNEISSTLRGGSLL